MKPWRLRFAVFVSALLGLTGCLAGAPTKASPALRVTVEMWDGSRVVGQPEQLELPFHSDLLGTIRLPVSRIQSLQWREKEAPKAHLKAVDGDELLVRLEASELRVKTQFGELKLPPDLIREVQISRSSATETLRRGLVALWSGEDSAQDSVGGHSGEMRYGADFAPGKVGRAFHFATDRGRVAIPDAPAFAFTGSFTIAGWVKVTEYPGPGGSGIISMRGDNRPGLDTWNVGTLPGNQISFGVSSADNEGTGVTAEASRGQWFHVAGVYDEEGKRLCLYLDGRLAAERENPVKPICELDASQEPGLGLGNHGGTLHVFPFRGLLDEWTVYSRALNPAEIQALVDLGNAGERLQPAPAAP